MPQDPEQPALLGRVGPPPGRPPGRRRAGLPGRVGPASPPSRRPALGRRGGPPAGPARRGRRPDQGRDRRRPAAGRVPPEPGDRPAVAGSGVGCRAFVRHGRAPRPAAARGALQPRPVAPAAGPAGRRRGVGTGGDRAAASVPASAGDARVVAVWSAAVRRGGGGRAGRAGDRPAAGAGDDGASRRLPAGGRPGRGAGVVRAGGGGRAVVGGGARHAGDRAAAGRRLRRRVAGGRVAAGRGRRGRRPAAVPGAGVGRVAVGRADAAAVGRAGSGRRGAVRPLRPADHRRAGGGRLPAGAGATARHRVGCGRRGDRAIGVRRPLPAGQLAVRAADRGGRR